MSAPVRTLVMRKQGLDDSGDTPANDLPVQPWLFFVVEDSTDDQQLARRILEKSPYAGEVICVPDGQSLFARMESMACFDEGAQSERCIVLLDINLIKGDGLQLLETLRTHPRTENIKIIMVTGELNANSVEASYRRHANAFIPKPLRPEHLDEIHAVMRDGHSGMKVH
ncbi:MAG TPA: response regulator [Alphaproteobacteria bacterium]